MGQENLFEGIHRSLKKNFDLAILIIALSIFVSFLINRFYPSVYQNTSLVRILTSNGLSDKDIAVEMNGVLAQKEIQDEIIKKCNLNSKYIKQGELAEFKNTDSGLFTLTVKYIDPNQLSHISNEVVKTLANRFLLYSAENQDFSTTVLSKKLEHLEDSISNLRKQKINLATKKDKTEWSDEIINLEKKGQILRGKIEDLSDKLNNTPKTIVGYSEEQYDSIKIQLARYRKELVELSKNYKEKHPKVLACQNNIKTLKNRLVNFKTTSKIQKNNPDYDYLLSEIKYYRFQLDNLKEEISLKKSLASTDFNSTNEEGIRLRIAALEELHKKTLIEYEESIISKTTNTGRINVLKKNYIPTQVVGFTAIQRDCLALLSGILLSIFLLYTPAPAKAEIVGISAEALATSLGAHLELSKALAMNKNTNKPLTLSYEPAQVILDVPPLVSTPLSLPCLLSEEEVLSLKYDERLIALNEPDSEILKPYKDLVENLKNVLKNNPSKIIIACSCKSKTGTTSVIANTGVLLAQAGCSVMIIDANFRKPSIHRIFGLNNVNGLSNLLNGEKIYNVIQNSPVDNLKIITSGIAPDSPERALNSTSILKLLDILKSRMEIILIDTPALLDYPETAILAGHTGMVAFVSKDGEPNEYLAESKQMLNQVGAKIMGYVKI